MDPMKIIVLANDSNYTYNLRRTILVRLIKEGHQVTVACEMQQFQKEMLDIGCRLIDIQTGRRGTDPLQDMRLLFRYLTVLRAEKPDLVLSYNIKPNVYGGLACRILGIRYMPNITGLGTALEYPGKLQLLTAWLYKLGVAGADCVFFQNEENQQFFERRKMLSSKTHRVLLPGSGVDLERNPVMPYPEGETVHFLFAARIMKEKGIDLFLAAARKYHSEQVVFDVCGGCDDETYLEILHKAAAEGVIRYHGHQTYMQPFYAQCSCLLYPSYYPEGMSNVLLEAAACGRPAIAANRSGCRETVEHGVTGYIVPVNDEAAVLDAVDRFLNLTCQQKQAMGHAARIKIEKEFDREIVVQAYTEQIPH